VVRFALGFVAAATITGCGLSLAGELAGDGGVDPDGGSHDGSTPPPSDEGGVDLDAGGSTDAKFDVSLDGKPPRERVTSGLIALYELEENGGTTVKDTSGFAPAVDLDRPASGTSWMKGALRFSGASIVRSAAGATKIATRCSATNEVTIEAWYRYGALGDWSRIVAMSSNNGVGNVAMTSNPLTLGFDLRSTADLYLRTTKDAFPNGLPQAIVHLVEVRTAAGAKRVYLDNKLFIDETQTGTFGNWDVTLPLSIGNTPAMDRQFYGDVHLVAIYDRALTAQEIAKNYAAGADP